MKAIKSGGEVAMLSAVAIEGKDFRRGAFSRGTSSHPRLPAGRDGHTFFGKRIDNIGMLFPVFFLII